MATNKRAGGPTGAVKRGKAAPRAEVETRRGSGAARGRGAGRFGPSRLNLIGGAVTLLIVLAVFGWAVFRSYATSTPAALANPNALNPAGQMLTAGSVAPDFTLRDAQGTAFRLAAQRGHPVLLEFFAVWCPICQGEAPIIAKLTKQYTPRGVRVWSVLSNAYGPQYDSSGRTDLTLSTASDLSWFARTFDVRHPQLIDPQFKTVNRYGINAYPGLYVVAPNGKITYVADSHESYSTLARQLDKALAVKRG